MLHVTVSDTQQTLSGCIQCCCPNVSLKPGETQPLYLNYAPWAVPIAERGLHCPPSVAIEEKKTCDTTSGNLPPIMSGAAMFFTYADTHLDGDLRAVVTDPEGVALVFKTVYHYMPKYGKLVLDSTGMFDYDPFPSMPPFIGLEKFFVSASDGVNEFVFEVVIGVGIDPTLADFSPVLCAGTPIVNQRFYQVMIPLAMSPSAQPCQVWGLTIRQAAADCDWNCFYKIDCVNVSVSKC